MCAMIDAERLRIYVSEQDRHGGKPMYEAIVTEARKRGLAGATVFRGVLGFGAASHVHSAKLLALSEDLPICVEISDTVQNIEGFLPLLEDWIGDGLITREKIEMQVMGDHARARQIMNGEER